MFRVDGKPLSLDEYSWIPLNSLPEFLILASGKFLLMINNSIAIYNHLANVGIKGTLTDKEATHFIHRRIFNGDDLRAAASNLDLYCKGHQSRHCNGRQPRHRCDDRTIVIVGFLRENPEMFYSRLSQNYNEIYPFAECGLDEIYEQCSELLKTLPKCRDHKYMAVFITNYLIYQVEILCKSKNLRMALTTLSYDLTSNAVSDISDIQRFLKMNSKASLTLLNRFVTHFLDLEQGCFDAMVIDEESHCSLSSCCFNNFEVCIS